VENERFDSLTRIVAQGAPRRTLLRGFLGAGLAAIVGFGPAWMEDVAAKKHGKRKKKCKNGTSKCAGRCVDLTSDFYNCGACGLQCANGQTCLNGQCPVPACTDTMNDRANCGACGNLCPDGASCVSGSCKCSAQEMLCDGACADLLADPDHCGNCETSCPEGGVCSLGECECPENEDVCGDECVDLQSNAAHCGECGHACPNEGTCIAGGCVEAGQFRIILRWDEFPNDLDSHLYLPPENPRVIYYSNPGDEDPGDFPYAYLDRDDTTGFGPETITIFDTVEGVYRYAVHNFRPAECCLATSGATVQLYQGNTLREEWAVPAPPSGDEALRWWHVFDMQSDGTIIDVNELVDLEPWPYEPNRVARALPSKDRADLSGRKRRKSKSKNTKRRNGSKGQRSRRSGN